MSWLGRLLVVLLVAVVGAAVPARAGDAKKRTVHGIEVSEGWSVGQGTFEGKPIITRFDLGLKPLVGNPAFPNQLGIAVPFKRQTANGLPTSEEVQELNAIEDEISKRFTVGDESLFAGVVTTNNMREFVLYTSDPKAAMAKAEKLRKEIKTHAIQFELHEDPGWQNFKDLAPK